MRKLKTDLTAEIMRAIPKAEEEKNIDLEPEEVGG